MRAATGVILALLIVEPLLELVQFRLEQANFFRRAIGERPGRGERDKRRSDHRRQGVLLMTDLHCWHLVPHFRCDPINRSYMTLR